MIIFFIQHLFLELLKAKSFLKLYKNGNLFFTVFVRERIQNAGSKIKNIRVWQYGTSLRKLKNNTGKKKEIWRSKGGGLYIGKRVRILGGYVLVHF